MVGEHLTGMISNCFAASSTYIQYYREFRGRSIGGSRSKSSQPPTSWRSCGTSVFYSPTGVPLVQLLICVDDIFEAPYLANQNRAWQLLVSLPLEQKAPQVEDLRKALCSPHGMVWTQEPLSNGYFDHCYCFGHLNILYVGLARPPSRLVACSPREICFESIQSQKHVYDSALISRSTVRDMARREGIIGNGLKGQEQRILRKTAALDNWLLTNDLAGTHGEYQELPHILKYIDGSGLHEPLPTMRLGLPLI